MKFTGQIKIPDLDHPGVPAVVLVEDNQAELLMQGESLGRWSLVDVRADRLIASAFSLALGHEEVTFIADEPVDFAYRGVEQMANVWARYRTMTLPRRLVASRRSRAGTKPSRIPELRSAMVDNLKAASSTATQFHEPIEEQHATRPEPRTHEPAPPAHARVEPTSPAESPAEPTKPPQVEVPSVPMASPDKSGPPPTVRPEDADIEVPSDLPELPTRPRPETDSDRPAARDIGAAGAPVESVFKETVPWLTPQHTDQVAEPVEEEPTAHEAAAFRQDAFAADNEPEAGAHADPASDDTPPEPDGFELDIPPVSPPPETPKQYVVDLGAFEDLAEEDVDARDAPEAEPAFAGAAEKGGIMGAVRAAFVRSRPQHDHEYVEAPGGIGIVRQICTECGHISIGTSD